jgi:beta-phosphoglucomutase-like phosphatase (HAD superfamily)
MPTTESKFRHVIFDLDGTILNTLDDLADSCNWMLARHGWPTHPVERYKYFIGNGMANLVRRASEEYTQDPEMWAQLLREFVAYYDIHKADKTRPYDGLHPVLDRLRQAGITCQLQRTPRWMEERGCGYSLGVKEIHGALDALQLRQVPFRKVYRRNGDGTMEEVGL